MARKELNYLTKTSLLQSKKKKFGNQFEILPAMEKLISDPDCFALFLILQKPRSLNYSNTNWHVYI